MAAIGEPAPRPGALSPKQMTTAKATTGSAGMT